MLRAMYNTQLQQAQYYQQQQQLYGGGATSPSAATIMASPYYYGCSLPASRMPYQHHHPHLPQPYNPQQHPQQQHQRFTSSFLVYPSSSPFSSPLQGLLSSTEGAYLVSFNYFYMLSILHLKKKMIIKISQYFLKGDLNI